jgi:hypothetical protein
MPRVGIELTIQVLEREKNGSCFRPRGQCDCYYYASGDKCKKVVSQILSGTVK